MAKKTPEIKFADEVIISKIYLVRKQKVMIDRDLAELYGVETKRLKEAVRRNSDRFPKDFMFKMNRKEFDILRTQFASSKEGRGGTRYLPMVFTEQGVTMLACILNSKRAITVNIQLIRIYTKLREMLLTHKDILLQLEKIQQKLTGHDVQIEQIFHYLKQLLNPPQPPRPRIGFRRSDE
jgi:phage regulator Rha-like protein